MEYKNCVFKAASSLAPAEFTVETFHGPRNDVCKIRVDKSICSFSRKMALWRPGRAARGKKGV